LPGGGGGCTAAYVPRGSQVGGEGRREWRKTREGREVQGKVELRVKVRLP